MLPQNAYFDNYHIYFQNKIVFSTYININFLDALGIGKIKPRYGKLTLRNCCTGYKIIILRTQEVKSQFMDCLRLHGISQVSNSMSKNTDMSTDKNTP